MISKTCLDMKIVIKSFKKIKTQTDFKILFLITEPYATLLHNAKTSILSVFHQLLNTKF